MRLLIDGDACPDRQKVIELALHYGVEAVSYTHLMKILFIFIQLYFHTLEQVMK